MSRIELQPAWLLHHRPYRDTSLLLEAFTLDHGRLGLVARGARGERSRSRGLLQPFRPLLLSWSGRSELGSLGGVEPRGEMAPLNGRDFVSGFYLNELLMRLLPRHDPHETLFAAYGAALARLAAGAPAEGVLRRFELALLEELGYGLNLDHDAADGSPIDPDRLYRYHPEEGPVAADAPGKGGVPLHGRTLLALRGGEPEGAEALRECKRLMRAALAPLLGGKPLKSRELFLSLYPGKTDHEASQQ